MGNEDFGGEAIAKLFRGGDIYKVPLNQRDYEWDKELLEYLWNDLLNSYKQKDRYYFFGSVVFQKCSRRP